MAKCSFCGKEFSDPVLPLHAKRCKNAPKKKDPAGPKEENDASDGGSVEDDNFKNATSADLSVYILSECGEGEYNEEDLKGMKRGTLLGIATAIKKKKEA